MQVLYEEEGELKVGGWLISPAEVADVFGDHETIWKEVCGRIGRRIVAPNIPAERLPIDPELN